MNIVSGITSETLSTLCVFEGVGLKQQIETSCLDNFPFVRSSFSKRIFEINVEFSKNKLSENRK